MASNFPLNTPQICTTCGLENEPLAIHCSTCLSWLPTEAPAPACLTWSCSSCNFINNGDSYDCVVCDEPRYGRDDPKTSALSKEDKKKDGQMQGNESNSREVMAQQLRKKINEINRNCHKENKKFVDNEFSPNKYSISMAPSALRDMVAGWRRPDEVVESKYKHLPWSILDQPTPADIIQGALGDCWLLNSISLIAEKPEKLSKIFVTTEYSKYGVYGIQLCIHGEWTNVIVDDLLPCDDHGRLVFAKGKRKQLWVPLLEKAFAKLYKDYNNLEGSGTLGMGHRMLTGFATQGYFIGYECPDQLAKDELYQKLSTSFKDKYFLCCNSSYSTADLNLEEVGLEPDHSYAILSVKTVFFEPLLLLRSTWGKGSWTGRWSEHSTTWYDILPELRPEEGIGNSRQGLFWISMDDFVRYFYVVVVCYDREGWFAQNVKAQLPNAEHKFLSSYQLEIEENIKMDIHTHQSALMFDFDERMEVTLMIFDEHWRLVGSSKCDDLSEATWAFGLLTPGKYHIYLFSHTAWCSDEAVNYSMVLHSSKPVQLTKIEQKSKVLADALFYYIQQCGTKRVFSIDGGFNAYIAGDDHWWGQMVAVVNETDNPYLLKASFSSQELRWSRPGTMEDVIPAHTRQVSQIGTTLGQKFGQVDLKLMIFKQSKSTKAEYVPKLSKQTKKIHRQRELCGTEKTLTKFWKMFTLSDSSTLEKLV